MMKRWLTGIIAAAGLAGGWWFASPLFVDKVVNKKRVQSSDNQTNIKIHEDSSSQVKAAQGTMKETDIFAGQFLGTDSFHQAEGTVTVVEKNVRLENFEVTKGPDLYVYLVDAGQKALALYHSFKPHLVVLDVMMPEMDGWQTAEEIRKQEDIPIIMLTALGQEKDKIYGLTIGADDYVTKPFSPRELLLRIKNVLRRTVSSPLLSAEDDIFEQNGLMIDRKKRKVIAHGRNVEVTAKEFELLSLLTSYPSQVFSKSQLIETLWGYDYLGDANTINVHIRRLREKIEQDPSNPQWIKTVWGIGYKFEGNHLYEN
jgi:DNA-binding response OmpR family regulator